MRPSNPADHPIHELQTKRWSPRAFDASKSIDIATMRSLLEAARWSPSSFNGQPWRFIVAFKEDKPEFAKLLDCLVEKNQSWAKSASALMLIVGVNVFDHNGKPNHLGKYDTGAATANLTFEATSIGIYVHQMAGYDAEKARTVYKIPPTADPIACMALGYLGDPATLPPDFRDMEEKPKPRKTIDEFTFHGTWGESANLTKE